MFLHQPRVLIFLCYFQASQGGGQEERWEPAPVSAEHAAGLLSHPGQEEPQEITRSEHLTFNLPA